MFFKGKVIFTGICRNYSKSSSIANELYVLSAVRTPIGLAKGVLNQFTAPELFFFAFKEALLRAVVPPEDIHNVFLGCSSCHDFNKDFLKHKGLSKTLKITPVPKYGIQNFINGAKFLLLNNQNICVVGGTVSGSNDVENEEDNTKKTAKHILSKQKVLEELVKSDHKNFTNAQKNGEFYDEIAKVIFRKKGHQITVLEDELPGKNFNFKSMNELVTNFKNSTFADGAAAFVIATENYVQKNKLTPIAKIISIAEESVNSDDFPQFQLLAIKKALKIGECQIGDISQWEIDSTMYSIFTNHFKVDFSVVNKNGALTLGFPFGLSGARALCQLIHSLSAGNLGCVASCDFSGTASAVIIKKHKGMSSGIPRLTLFTKTLCPLCEELKQQLKPFQGRFLLQEVDIEAEENKKYKELYKYEIPVLFLEGRFLCKHKLEPENFNRRLLEFENFD